MSLLPTMGGSSWPLRLPKLLSEAISDKNEPQRLFKGFISEDCLISVVYSGAHLEVLSPVTGDRLAAWTFSPTSMPERSRKHDAGGANSGSSQCEITSCVDMCPQGFPSSRVTNDKSLDGRYLCIGLDDGRVCIFNVFSSKIIRCVQLPSRITALQCLTTLSSVPRHLCEELLILCGLVAVGTQEGHLFLVDFALDEESSENLIDDGSNPCSPLYIDLSGGTERVANHRTLAAKRGQYLCVCLDNLVPNRKKRANVFSFTDDKSGETVHFPDTGVLVSSLAFFPQIGGLLAGYNFGAWQYWNISAINTRGGVPISLDYSSPYVSQDLPVVGFCFQEPENDPRNFVYVWVLRGDNDLDSEEEKEVVCNFASIHLFALAFQNKDENYSGVLYSGLMSCQQRFHHRLDGLNPNLKAKGSLCLGGATIPTAAPHNTGGGSGQSDLSEIDEGQVNLGLCSFLWELIRQSDEDPKFFLGTFDLNAWYQDQMPAELSVTPASQCPYFSFCSLDETLMDEEGKGNSHLLHGRIDLTSISRYRSATNAEQHFYPSSLAFNIIFFLDFGFIHASHLGLQRKILLELRSLGKDSLVDPSRLHSVFVVAGLVEDDDNKTLEQQRSSLLNAALNHHLVDFLKGCLIHWSDGKYSQAGCTLNFFLNWAWNTVATIKQSIDKVTLLKLSGASVERELLSI